MKAKIFLVSLVTATSLAGPAAASCIINKAICQAICDRNCCDGLRISAPVDPAALRRIPRADLQAELDAARSRNAWGGWFDAIDDALKDEMDRQSD